MAAVTAANVYSCANPTSSDANFPAPRLRILAGNQVQSFWEANVRSGETLAPPATEAPGDEFEPRVTSIEPSSSTPVVTLFTHQLNPGGMLSVHGESITGDSGSDTAFWIYSQTGPDGGFFGRIQTLRAEPKLAHIAMPRDIAYSAYMVWPSTAAGVGWPFMVNKAEAWWVGPDRARPGSQVSVYGRSLSRDNATRAAYVYLRPWGAAGNVPAQPVHVSSVNPYKLTFDIPDTLGSDRTYEVWVHNGHGGRYGWGGPLPLRVERTEPYQWAGAIREITHFGARPDDGNDDSAALESALAAAQDGDTIRFPPGRYVIARRIAVTRAVSIDGAGAELTTIDVPLNTLNAEAVFHIRRLPSRVRNLAIRCQVRSGLYGQGGLIMFDGDGVAPTPSGGIVENTLLVSVPGSQYPTVGVRSANEITIRNNTFETGYAVHLDRSFQVFVLNNRVNGNWPDQVYSSQAAVISFASHEVEIAGNIAGSIDRDSGKTLSRFFVGQGHSHGSIDRHYIAHNQTLMTGCRQHNCGEQILIETPGTFYTGPLVAVKDRTMTFFGVNWRPQYFAAPTRNRSEAYNRSRPSHIYIQRGPGEGQYRRITGNTSNSLTIERAWDRVPDSSSLVTIGTVASHIVIYDNRLEGWLGAAVSTSATNGIQTYGSAFDIVIDGNTVSSMRVGIGINALNGPGCGPTGTVNCPNWSVLVANNKVIDSRVGIMSSTRLEVKRDEPSWGPMLLNTSLRGNAVHNSLRDAISIGDANGTTARFDPAPQYGTTAEANTLARSFRYVRLGFQQSATTLRGNHFLDAPFPGGMALQFDSEAPLVHLYENVYSPDVTTRYAGVIPPPGFHTDPGILDVTLGPADTSPVVHTVRVLTNSVPPVRIHAEPDADWLNVDMQATDIHEETAVLLVHVTVDPSILPPGLSTGAIRFTSGNGAPPRKVDVVVTRAAH